MSDEKYCDQCRDVIRKTENWMVDLVINETGLCETCIALEISELINKRIVE